MSRDEQPAGVPPKDEDKINNIIVEHQPISINHHIALSVWLQEMYLLMCL